VDVNNPAYLDVNIKEVNVPGEGLYEGETYEVVTYINNTGGEPITDTIEHRVNGTLKNEITTTWSAEESRERSFSWTAENGSAPEVVNGIISANTSDSTTVEVREPVNLSVEDFTTNDSVAIDRDTLAAEGVINNTGGDPYTDTQQTINFTLNGSTIDSTAVNISENSTIKTTENFTYDNFNSYHPEATVGISSENDSAIKLTDIRKPADLNVSSFTFGDTNTVSVANGDSFSDVVLDETEELVADIQVENLGEATSEDPYLKFNEKTIGEWSPRSKNLSSINGTAEGSETARHRIRKPEEGIETKNVRNRNRTQVRVTESENPRKGLKPQLT